MLLFHGSIQNAQRDVKVFIEVICSAAWKRSCTSTCSLVSPWGPPLSGARLYQRSRRTRKAASAVNPPLKDLLDFFIHLFIHGSL